MMCEHVKITLNFSINFNRLHKSEYLFVRCECLRLHIHTIFQTSLFKIKKCFNLVDSFMDRKKIHDRMKNDTCNSLPATMACSLIVQVPGRHVSLVKRKHVYMTNL